MSVHAYHPGTGADLVISEDTLAHLRVSGWVTRSEWDEQQAAAQAAEKAAEKATAEAGAATSTPARNKTA